MRMSKRGTPLKRLTRFIIKSYLELYTIDEKYQNDLVGEKNLLHDY